MAGKIITQGKILEIFEILFGDEIIVRPSQEHLAPESCMTIARYVAESGEASGWFYADGPFAAGAGGALTMLPSDVVKEAITQNALSGMMADNVNEIMNICSSLIQSEANGHIRYDGFGKATDYADLPAAGAGVPSSYEVQFQGYGKGRFTIVVC